MSSEVIFHNTVCSSWSDLNIAPNTVLFHGDAVDDRGESVLGGEENDSISKILVNYDFDQVTLKVGDQEINADKAKELFANLIINKNVVLEATTLGFAELFLCVKALLDLNIFKFLIIYVEPEDYNRTKKSADSFDITEVNSGYKPIPNAIVDLAGDDVEAGVFFLGYESNRIERAFEEYQMIASKELKLIFGIPAYQPGWELNSIVPHLPYIKNYHVNYCAANDPSSAYESLEATLRSIDSDNKMFIAPIGTKPCGIASAIFTSLNPRQVGLLYDHRKKKVKRSSGITIWHKYSVKIST